MSPMTQEILRPLRERSTQFTSKTERPLEKGNSKELFWEEMREDEGGRQI